MSNWWQKWAEQVGRTLAEMWLESRSETQAENPTPISEMDLARDSSDENGTGNSTTPSQDENDDT